MSIDSQNQELPIEVTVTWIIGATLSAMCVLIQLLLLYFLPKLREADQKLLIQLSISRLMNTIVEYLYVDIKLTGNKTLVRNAITALYVQTDVVLICWMVAYTKNMYIKMQKGIKFQKWRTLTLSLYFWFGALPIGIMYSLFTNLPKSYIYDSIYGTIKFLALSVNILIFCKIFYYRAIQPSEDNKDLKRIFRMCIISFLLVCITSLQVVLTDFFSFYTNDTNIALSFCVINSYQVLAISIIFGIASKNTI